MTSPYHNRLPMAYLPASRAVESVGIPPMFRSRVRGLCSIEPGGHNPYDPLAWKGAIDPKMFDRGIEGPKLAVCHSQSPAGTCMPPDWTPPVAPAPTTPKPSAGLMGLPLILGAAYLLLS